MRSWHVLAHFCPKLCLLNLCSLSPHQFVCPFPTFTWSTWMPWNEQQAPWLSPHFEKAKRVRESSPSQRSEVEATLQLLNKLPLPLCPQPFVWRWQALMSLQRIFKLLNRVAYLWPCLSLSIWNQNPSDSIMWSPSGMSLEAPLL